jgi:hypothetical protein
MLSFYPVRIAWCPPSGATLAGLPASAIHNRFTASADEGGCTANGCLRVEGLCPQRRGDHSHWITALAVTSSTMHDKALSHHVNSCMHCVGHK